MMILDKKSYDLLSYLIKLETPETVMAISRSLNQSRRKIYYHLEKINEALPEDVEQIISYPRMGILLNPQQKAACRLLLKEVTDYNYVMKSDERKRLSAIYIAVSPGRVTIDKLMQVNDVSRNTVLNDLNELREELAQKEYGIQLHATKSRGYYFECHPLPFIQYLYKLLDDIYHGSNPTFIDYFDRRLEELRESTIYFSKDVQTYFHEYLLLSQGSLGKTLNRQDSQFMVRILPFILLSYQNMGFSKEVKESLQKDFSLIWKRKEYLIAKDFATQLFQHFKISLDKVEVGLIAMLMLSFRKDRDNHAESGDYRDMRLTIETFINEIEERYHLHFGHKEELLKQLTIHCKSLVYRKAYGIFSMNPLTNHIKEKYETLFTMTQSCVFILENSWGIQLTDDDVAYLTIHLGGELRNSRAKQKVQNVVIVSDDGIGIKKLLLKQCQRYLSNCRIEAVFTTEQFQSVRDLMSIDMVISTMDTLDSPFPQIVVHSILSDEDIIRLIRFSKQGRLSETSDLSRELDKAIAQFVKEDSERNALKNKIKKIIRQELMQDISLEQ